MINEDRKKLYDALSSEYDLGTYEEFERNIGDSVKRKKLYDAASADYDLGDFESYSQRIGPTHKESLDMFTAEHGSWLNDFEARDSAEMNMGKAGMSSGIYVPTEGAITGEERKKYLELHKQEEALKKAWFTSDEYLAQKDADALFLSDARNGLNKQIMEYSKSNPVLKPEGAFQINPYATRGAEADAELEKYSTASRILDDAIKMHNAPSKYDGANVWQNIGKFGKGAADTLSDVDFWFMGLTEIADNLGVRDVLSTVQEKLGNLNDLSEESIENILSPAEKAVLQAWAINTQEQLKRKDDLSRGYQAGKGAVESLGFMAEFALTGGIGKAATEGVEQMAKWLGKKALTKVGGMTDDVAAKVLKETGEKIAQSTVGKYGVGLAESLAEAAGRTGVMPSTFRNISEKATEIETDENGNNYLVKMNDAFAKGYVDSFIENLSEGGRVNALGTLFGDVAGKIPAYKKMVDKFSHTKASELWDAFNSSGVMNTLRAGGWHGLGEEYLEEWYGNALRTLTGVDKEALKDFATVDNQIITLTSFLPMTIFGGTVSTAQVLSANKDLEKKAAALKSALMERGYDEAQANNMIDMMRGAAPAEVSETLTPIVNSVANRNTNEAAGLMKPVGEFAAAVQRWQSFNTKYNYQEQEQRDGLRTQMEENLGQFWQQDENGRQTVQRGVNEKGEVVYMLGKPSAEDVEAGATSEVAAVTSDGRKVFVNPSEYQLEDELEMNAFLGNEIMAEKGNQEQARMIEEKEAKIAAIRETAVPGTAVNIGTAEAPMQAIVLQRNPDGVIVNTPDGQTRQMTYEEFGNYVGVNAVPMTDAQIDEHEADVLTADRAQREAALDQEYDNDDAALKELAEAEDEIEQAVDTNSPLPMKADGSVDQNALWNNDPERWAQWNDEQRQDGGANSLAYVSGAIAKEQAKIAELQAAYAAESDFDARDAIEKEIADTQARVGRLTAIQQGYVAQAEAAAAPVVETQQKPQTEDEKAKVENQRREPLRKKAKELSSKLGVKVNIAESLTDVKETQAKEQILRIDMSGSSERATGWYNPATGEVTIYLPHTENTKEVEKTIIHEIVAHKGLRALLGEEGFNVLCDSVWDMMTEEERAKFLAYPGVNGNKRAAADEYIAHYAEKLNIEESKPVWDRIMDLVMRILNSMGIKLELTKEDLSNIIVASYHNLMKEAQANNEIVAETELAEVFSEEQLNAPNSGTAQQITAADGEVLADTDGKGGVRFSIRTWNEGGRDYLASWLANDTTLTDEEKADILARMDEFYKNALLYSDTYAPFGTWSDAGVRYDNNGNPLMSVIKANGDYAMNLDFSLVCKKRRPLNRLLRTLVNRNAFATYTLRERELAEINWILQEHGFEVACALCFVDSKRYRVTGVADVFAALYNRLVKSLAPEGVQIAHFNYNENPNVEVVENGLDTMSDDQLNWDRFDRILSAYKPGSVEHKVAQYLREHPEARKLVDATDFIEAEGFESVKENNPNLLKFYNMKKGTGGPKASFGDVQYLNDILKKEKSFDAEKAYAVGGVRLQSFSDFVPHMYFDYMQLFAELAAKKLPLHAYTKEVLFAKIFGLTGAKINMSLVPAVVEGGIAPGLDAEGNYAWADPVTDAEGNVIQQGQSFPYDEAMAIQQAEGYSKNCGIIAVGISDAHIEKMLDDPNIPFIIPYHKSSLNAIVARMTNIDQYKDYTNVQNTRKASGSKLDKGTKDFNFNEYLHSLGESGTPQQAAQAYLDWCRENNYKPKFSQFAYHPNYYKLLQDFNTIDLATGEYAPQGAVTMTFPTEESAFGNVETLIQQGLQEDAELEEKMEQEIDGIADQVLARLEEISKEPKMSEKQQAKKMAELADERTAKIKAKAKGPIDLVEEAKKADLRHRVTSEGALVPGHKKGEPMLSDAEMMADVSFRITKNTKATIETWFNKAGVDAEMTEATINYLDYAFEDTTEQLCAAKWYLNGKISLPDEDEYKVRDAVKVAKQNKVDALSYASPMDILNTFGQPKSKVKPIDPDTVKEFSNKKELAEGIVVYDVQDDFEGQAAVRKIIDTHWGEDANPWCLAARTNGDLERAKDMWLHYSKYPKRIAFRNGKLLAFYASANDKTWWDRNDEPHTNIPYSVKSKEGEYEVSTNYELKEGNKKAKKVSVGKSDKKGRTAYFVGNRLEYAGIQDGERNLFYSSYSMGATLSDTTYGVGRSLEVQYGPYKNVTQISFERRTKDEPTYYVRVGYGNNGVRAISFVEGARSWDIRYGINGDQIFVGIAQLNFDLTNELSNVYSGAYHMYRINDEEYEISRGREKVGIVKKGEKVTMQMLEAFGEDGAPVGVLLDFINDNGWNRADYPYPNPADADLLRRDDEVREQIRKVENEINEIAGGRYLSSVPAIRFRVLDTTNAELKEKPIKLNGMYRFNLKNAFKGVRDNGGSYPYIKVQLEEVPEDYSGEKIAYNGILEGFAVVRIPKGLITEGEKDNVFFIDPKNIENELWTVLRATENYYEFKHGSAPYQRDWLNTEGVRFRMANENQAIFVSNAAKAVEGIKQEKATPEQWLKMIEKNGGLKAGEDKWMGLSDWLKASDKKTLTKQEVLDFINENMIIIEEQHYSNQLAYENNSRLMDEKYPGWRDAFSFEWDDYRDAPNADILDGEEAATLYNKYNEDKVEVDEDGEIVDDADRNKVILWGEDLGKILFGLDGNAVRPIHDTREVYTTKGLINRHEIALTVPTIESWGKSDMIHFGDAGDGRAVAWIRFGETSYKTVSEDSAAYNESIDALYAYWDYLREKYGNGWADAMTEAEKAEEKRIQHKYKIKRANLRKKVLVIDEIQSKRHQEGREKGYKSDFKNSKEAQRLKAEVDRVTARLMELVNDRRENEESELTELARLDIALDNAASIAEYDAILEEQEKIRTHRENREAEELAVRGERRELAYLLDKQIDRDAVSAISAVPDAPFDKNWHELAMKRMLRYAAENGYDVIAWTKGEQQADRYNLGKIYNEIEREDNPNIEGRTFSFSGGNYDKVTVNEDGVVVDSTIEEAKGKSLSDLVGKDLAVKMMSLENYDTIDEEDLRIGGEGMKGFYDKMLPAFMNKYGKKWGVKVEDIELPNLENGLTMHSVPVTEEMKASVMEGQVMFRIRGENESAENFYNSVVEEYKAKYTELGFIEAYPINEETANEFGYTLEELEKIGGNYDPETNISAIFVHEDANDSVDVEGCIFHEQIHFLAEAFPYMKELGKWMRENAETSSYLSRIKETVDAEYEEYWKDEEMLSHAVSVAMAAGVVSELEQMVPQEHRGIISEIEKEIGYDRATEESSRRAGQNLSRAESEEYTGQTSEKKVYREFGQELSAEESIRFPERVHGVSEREEASPASAGSNRQGRKSDASESRTLTAAERRVINEYFPGAFAEPIEQARQDVDQNPTEAQSDGMEIEDDLLPSSGMPTDEVVANGLQLTPAQTAEVAANIFAALPEESRKKITEGLNGNVLGLKDAILQIPASLASKENWNEEDKQMANVVAEEMTKMAGEMTRPFSAEEGLWLLYNNLNKGTDLISQASRALVQRNLGFDAETLAKQEQAKDGVRFRTVGDATSNAQASLYNRGAVNVWTRLKESFVDMQASVEELVKAIEKRTGKVAQGFENILLALNQQSSKGLAAMESYTQRFLNPMFDEIRRIMDETKMKYEDVVRYVILKHGLERNKKLAQRDARAHYQEIYDDIISKITGMTAAQKRTYLTNAQLKEADAKAELATLQAVDMSAMTDEEKREHKKKLAAARKAVEETEEHLKRAQKIASLSEQEAQDELDKIFEKIENGTDSVFKEMRENDYSGISSMFYDQLGVDRKNFSTEEQYQAALMEAKKDRYSSLKDIEAAAEAEVKSFEGKTDTKELWKRINAATKETLRQQYEANMISKDQYLNLRDMFEYYVPLRGFKDNTAEDMYTYYRKPNSTGYTKPILGAEGRKTEAESPFGWIAAMAGSAIASNVKNEAKLALFYFVSNRPENGIATISRTWFVHTPGDVDANGKKIFRPAYPPFSEDLSTDAAKQAYEDWQEQMRDLQKQGLAYEAGQRLNLGNAVVNISDANKPEHIVNVKVGGKDYTIIINGNPRAAQAINGDLNIEGTAQDYSALFGPVLRWMSSVNTSYNPEFWITNMMRDMAFTMMAVNIKEDPVYRRKFSKNYRKAFKVVSLVAKNEKGTIGDSYLEQQYKDFVKYGGVTGYTQIKDSETWEQEIENYLSSTDPESLKSGKVMRGMKSVFHVAHRFGESLEQVSRFAAFLTARETGKSINEAINDAKEITVNFNRKGSGKMITLEEAKYLTGKNGQPLTKRQQWMVVGLSSIAPLGRRFIMFFNAAIQGLNATYKLMKKNPKRFTGWALGYAAVGMMNAVLHAMLDDDDDYLDIPQYERRNSLMIGGNGAYFKWALPQEARAFYALGDLAVETVMGRNPHQNVLGEALKIGTEILPVNPSEGWKAFMPSVAIPFIELALNEDYKGAPIYNDQKWLSEEEKEKTAKWSNAYQGTGWTYVKIAQGLNFITGGDKHDAGWINLQPEKLEHLVQSAFGGTIRTADKFINTISAALDPEEPMTIRQTPFLNRFLTINDERFKNVHVNDVFDYYKADAEHALTLEKQYIKDRDMDSLTELRSSDEYQWAKIYGKYKKPLKAIQDKIKVADGTAEKKELMKQQDELKKRMIKEISEL